MATSIKINWQKINWQEVVADAIPLLLAWAVTRQLNLQGWRAILAYLLVAGTSREVIDQLAPESMRVPLLPEFTLGGGDANGHDGHAPNGEADLTDSAEAEETAPFQVVHASPGRLRLRLPHLATDPACGEILREHLMAGDRFPFVRINPLTASLTVKYNLDQVSEAEVREYLATALVQHQT